ncbi:hypothetical protein HF086_018443 [Spodoptera exigua]|uniref:GATOR1 complex protein NPRL3 C-terminal HTH domain-containing protein n=1 Tax=Spodoptera exigua TaxID=7107 RepID=A0A922SAH2_SPOEX|nr:hypothetical protein HF086_018443 [Spodoptera exigua]
MEVNPLNIFFVKSDSKGDRLLFRYPYTTENKDESKQKKYGRHNPYAINSTEDLLQNPQSQTSNICKGQLSGFTDEMLSTLFAVKAELCNRKFELKVNDVRFVGHPTLLPYRTNKDDTATMILINIVFALQASASHSVVKCYYDLSKRLGKALRHEEKRCSYLTEEMKIMLAAHDEVSVLDSEMKSDNDEDEDNLRHSVSSATYSSIVQCRINKWVLLSFCLPHKAHQIHNRGLIIEPETIDKCLQKLRPYHGILLMVNPNDLLGSIPLDSSSALLRLIKLYSPLKSLQTLAIEADLTLKQMLSEFSLPAPLWYVSRNGSGGGGGGGRLARCVAWLLRRRLLLQLHTYVQFNSPHWGRDPDGKEYYCEKHDVFNQSCSVSFSSLNQMQLNVPEPVEPRETINTFPDSDEDYPTENNLNQTDFSHTKPIVIESEHIKYEKFRETDSANHSFDDGIDVVDGVKPTNGCDYESKVENGQKKIQGNSVDSGISSNMNGTNNHNGNGEVIENGHTDIIKSELSIDKTDSDKKSLPSRLSDISLKDSETTLNKDTSSDEDKFESDQDISPRIKMNGMMNGGEKKNGVSLNLKFQSEMSFQPPTVWNVPASCDVIDACYFRGEQHLEEIMFMENVSRSQLMQLLDKFKDVLITFETEDPAVAMLYPYQ